MKKKLLSIIFIFLLANTPSFVISMQNKTPLHTVILKAQKEQLEFNKFWAKKYHDQNRISGIVDARITLYKEEKKSNKSINSKKIKKGAQQLLVFTSYTAIGAAGLAWSFFVLRNDNATFKNVVASLGTALYGIYKINTTYPSAMKGIKSLYNGIYYQAFLAQSLIDLSNAQNKITAFYNPNS